MEPKVIGIEDTDLTPPVAWKRAKELQSIVSNCSPCVQALAKGGEEGHAVACKACGTCEAVFTEISASPMLTVAWLFGRSPEGRLLAALDTLVGDDEPVDGVHVPVKYIG